MILKLILRQATAKNNAFGEKNFVKLKVEEKEKEEKKL